MHEHVSDSQKSHAIHFSARHGLFQIIQILVHGLDKCAHTSIKARLGKPLSGN